MDSVDFLIIGAGIAGASAAFQLAHHGTVAVAEAEATAGYHTTGRSAALFTESYERGTVQKLAIASRSFLDEPPEGFADSPLLSPLPVLLVAQRDQQGSLEELIAACVGIVDVELVEGAVLLDTCPVLDPEVVVGGVLEPHSMEIDVHALHQGFLTGARSRGATVATGARVETLAWNGTSWRVRMPGSEIEAGVVVNAAGAWADTVARLADVPPIGLTPLRRTAFTFLPHGRSDVGGFPMVVDVDEHFYFKPERTQLMGSLAEETPMHPHDVRPDEIDVALAIERIQAATTMEIRHVRRTWAGLRTFAPDRQPVVGFEPGHPGFFWLAGQGGYGIMTSPAMAAAAAGLLTGGELPSRLRAAGLMAEAIDPGRFRGADRAG